MALTVSVTSRFTNKNRNMRFAIGAFIIQFIELLCLFSFPPYWAFARPSTPARWCPCLARRQRSNHNSSPYRLSMLRFLGFASEVNFVAQALPTGQMQPLRAFLDDQCRFPPYMRRHRQLGR